MQLQKVMEHLGFTENEAKVYLAALRLGDSHVSDMAEEVKLPRSTVQVVVNKLQKEGLMNFYVIKRYKFWVAEKPDKLMTRLRDKEDELQLALPKLSYIRKESIWKKRSSKNQESLDWCLGPLRVVAEGINHAVLITNDHFKIEYVNDKWEDLFGYKLNEVYGKDLRLCKNLKTPQDEYDRMWSTLNAGGLFKSDKIILRSKRGSFLNLSISMFSVRRDGRIFYIQISDKQPDEIHPKDLFEG